MASAMEDICFSIIFEIIIYVIFAVIVSMIMETTGLSEGSSTFFLLLIIGLLFLFYVIVSKLGNSVSLDKNDDGKISDKEWADLDGDGELSVDEIDFLSQQNSKEELEPIVAESLDKGEWWNDGVDE